MICSHTFIFTLSDEKKELNHDLFNWNNSVEMRNEFKIEYMKYCSLNTVLNCIIHCPVFFSFHGYNLARLFFYLFIYEVFLPLLYPVVIAISSPVNGRIPQHQAGIVKEFYCNLTWTLNIRSQNWVGRNISANHGTLHKEERESNQRIIQLSPDHSRSTKKYSLLVSKNKNS